jgi:peptidoglycan/xylan/chitin deacetylase (PgdA/CDA1 family)
MVKLSERNKLLPVLAYHEISEQIELNKNIRSMQPAYCIHKSKFEEQMKLISTLGFCTILSPGNSVVNCFNRVERGGRGIILTFDDGHIGNYEFAFPILKKNNLKAVFFVTVNFIEKANMLSWKMLRKMAQDGMSIQSHCMSHDPLETLDRKTIEYQLVQSKKIIEDEVGSKVDSISMPHGSINKKIFSIARQSGYNFVYGSAINYFDLTSDGNEIIPRIPIIEKFDIKKFRELIEIDQCYVQTQNALRLLRIAGKKIIGINNYRRLYRFFFRIKIEE